MARSTPNWKSNPPIDTHELRSEAHRLQVYLFSKNAQYPPQTFGLGLGKLSNIFCRNSIKNRPSLGVGQATARLEPVFPWLDLARWLILARVARV